VRKAIYFTGNLTKLHLIRGSRIIFIFFIILFWTAISFAQKKEGHKMINNYGGIGISIEIDSAVHLPYIVEIISGKPGALAGLRSGDHILAINHWKTKNKTKDQVVNHLRGIPGSLVHLKIGRNNAELKFDIKRQKIEVLEQPANPCDALNLVIKAAADTFQDLKGKLRSDPVQKNQVPYYEWESKIKLPKFSKSLIVKTYDHEAYFQGIYFIGKDSIQAVQLNDRLVSEVRECLPYTCTESYQENNSSDITGFTNTFIISQVKSGNSDKIKGSILIIRYKHTQGGVSEVSLVCETKR
jgi:membrane-associated protease RseP (regulator of RpoE activity)